MFETSPSSQAVPYGADQTLFVIIDRISGAREIRVERTDLDQAIDELLSGCFNDPVRVMSFNTLEHWMKDISNDIAAELQSRCDIEGIDVPDHLRDFIETNICAGGIAPAKRTEFPGRAQAL